MPLSSSVIADIIGWDVATWSRALRFWEDHLGGLDGCEALEIGARNGGLSLWLALKGVRVECTDLLPPGDAATALFRRYGVAGRIHTAAADATCLPYPDGRFDLVAFKSVLGGIGGVQGREGQARAMSELYRVLKPGGRLLYAENLTGTPIHRELRRRFAPWSHAWRYVTLEEMETFLAPFAKHCTETTGLVAVWGRYDRLQRLLGVLEAVLLPFTQPRWRYVAYGVAMKG